MARGGGGVGGWKGTACYSHTMTAEFHDMIWLTVVPEVSFAAPNKSGRHVSTRNPNIGPRLNGGLRQTTVVAGTRFGEGGGVD